MADVLFVCGGLVLTSHSLSGHQVDLPWVWLGPLIIDGLGQTAQAPFIVFEWVCRREGEKWEGVRVTHNRRWVCVLVCLWAYGNQCHVEQNLWGLETTGRLKGILPYFQTQQCFIKSDREMQTEVCH